MNTSMELLALAEKIKQSLEFSDQESHFQVLDIFQMLMYPMSEQDWSSLSVKLRDWYAVRGSAVQRTPSEATLEDIIKKTERLNIGEARVEIDSTSKEAARNKNEETGNSVSSTQHKSKDERLSLTSLEPFAHSTLQREDTETTEAAEKGNLDYEQKSQVHVEWAQPESESVYKIRLMEDILISRECKRIQKARVNILRGSDPYKRATPTSAPLAIVKPYISKK